MEKEKYQQLSQEDVDKFEEKNMTDTQRQDSWDREEKIMKRKMEVIREELMEFSIGQNIQIRYEDGHLSDIGRVKKVSGDFIIFTDGGEIAISPDIKFIFYGQSLSEKLDFGTIRKF